MKSGAKKSVGNETEFDSESAVNSTRKTAEISASFQQVIERNCGHSRSLEFDQTGL